MACNTLPVIGSWKTFIIISSLHIRSIITTLDCKGFAEALNTNDDKILVKIVHGDFDTSIHNPYEFSKMPPSKIQRIFGNNVGTSSKCGGKYKQTIRSENAYTT